MKAAVTIVMLVSGVWIAPSVLAADVPTILVFPFENLSNDRNLDWIGEGVGELIADRLKDERGVYVFSRDERLVAYERLGIPENPVLSRASLLRIAWDLGADYLVTGTYRREGDVFDLTARVIDLAATGSRPAVQRSGRLEDVVQIAQGVGWDVLKQMAPWTAVTEGVDFSVTPPVPPSALEHYTRGLLTVEPQTRIKLLQDAIRLHPRYTAAALQLGRTLYLEKEYKDSAQWLDRVARSSPEWAYARFLAGLDYIHVGEYSNAFSAFSAIPKTYDVLVNLGAALFNKGEQVEGIQAWRRAIEHEPLATEAYFNLGYAMLLRGDAEAAIRYLDQVVRLHGRDGEGQFLLSKAYERLGRTEDAQRSMSQALRQSSRVERWQASGTVPTKIERLRTQPSIAALRLIRDDSVTVADPIWTPQRLARWAKTQDLNTRLEAVQSLMDAQLFGQAALELRDIILGYPESSDAHLYLAQVYERQRAYEAAIKEYELSIGIRESMESLLALARVHKIMNKVPQAIAAVDRALKLDPAHAGATSMKTELERSLQQQRRNRQ